MTDPEIQNLKTIIHDLCEAIIYNHRYPKHEDMDFMICLYCGQSDHYESAIQHRPDCLVIQCHTMVERYQYLKEAT